MIARGTQCKRLIVFLLAERLDLFSWFVFTRCKRLDWRVEKQSSTQCLLSTLLHFFHLGLGSLWCCCWERGERFFFLSPGQSAALMVWFASRCAGYSSALPKPLKAAHKPAYLFSCVRPHTTDLGECHGNRYYRFSCASVSFEPVLTTCYRANYCTRFRCCQDSRPGTLTLARYRIAQIGVSNQTGGKGLPWLLVAK